MVRLGAERIPLKAKELGSFNSSMVRLGAFYFDAFPLPGYRFNSSMVRLGAVKILTSRENPSWFQFQYGSIGSSICHDAAVSLRVSIPVWFDWEFAKVSRVDPRNTVSIPVWFDWEYGRRYGGR